MILKASAACIVLLCIGLLREELCPIPGTPSLPELPLGLWKSTLAANQASGKIWHYMYVYSELSNGGYVTFIWEMGFLTHIGQVNKEGDFPSM